jgi:thiol:disulfide interchange protein DsbC
LLFYIKLLPLKIHPEAIEEAKTIVCEKSLTLFEDTFEKKPLPEPPCQTTVVDETMRLTEKLGIY